MRWSYLFAYLTKLFEYFHWKIIGFRSQIWELICEFILNLFELLDYYLFKIIKSNIDNLIFLLHLLFLFGSLPLKCWRGCELIDFTLTFVCLWFLCLTNLPCWRWLWYLLRFFFLLTLDDVLLLHGVVITFGLFVRQNHGFCIVLLDLHEFA